MSAAANESDASSEGATAATPPSQYKILTLTFNQDCTALSMGTVKTYALFTINPENKTEENQDYTYEGIHIIERLFSSSLIALVSNQAPRQLRVCYFRKGSEIHTDIFPTNILAVKLNRSRLVVCLEESIWIYDIRNMKIIYTIRDVPSNPNGLCALSSNDSNPYLAYPGSSINGKIQIFDTISLKPGVEIAAHSGLLAAMAFDITGARLATASDKGTVIRVHNPSDGVCLFEFRRGVRRVATIYSLAFSPDSMFLASSSNTGTIHIFRLISQTQEPVEGANTWTSMLGHMVSTAASYLPISTPEVWTQDRSFAIVHLQSTVLKTIVAMNIFNKKLILFVVAYDGMVYVYEVNMNEVSDTHQIITTNQGRNSTDGSVGPYPPNLFRNENDAVASSSTSANKKTS